MSENAWLLDTIKAKSDQLNACDLIGGPITVTVKAVKKCTGPDQPVAIELGGGLQPFKPCKSMRRVLIGAWGVNGWVGRSMTLYCDTEVKFGGVSVGGIRISHLSHIASAIEIPLTLTRGKSSIYTVQPLKVTATTETLEDRIGKVIAAIQRAKSKDELDKVMRLAGPLYETLTTEQQATIDDAKLAKGFA